ncbi:hypothetical protein [Halorubrum sp. GN11GM_10-3_MGM]|uniref:hypothetical protein n=1 Tax=Halorubrum sp. GN11GM_10-3_MGM TaxID=2518111 RepID=UPI0010F714CE|nr:hypothetical protein [Halorubrum sp. GN11GM_10-3_MGM]TKX67638.1 hypothetical protein EXE40_14645 [Halorubrum sp. GN11GM_10-3_MGM]
MDAFDRSKYRIKHVEKHNTFLVPGELGQIMIDRHEFQTAVSYPILVAIHLHGLVRDVFCNGTDGVPVVEKDWDNLIILDACRYDLFQEVSEVDGELSPAVSLGSSTGEFMRKNFGGGEFLDLVYISEIQTPQR